MEGTDRVGRRSGRKRQDSPFNVKSDVGKCATDGFRCVGRVALM
jgi:hypothetical protein